MGDAPEIWKNETRGPVGVRKNDPRNPGGTKVELVRPGGQVIISAEERRFTEEMVRLPVNNPFRNGRLLLVSGADDDPELQAIKADPNSIGREDIDKQLFEGNLKAMQSKLAKIDSIATLQRILDVADTEGASTRRVQAIRDRIAEVGGTTNLPNAGDGPTMAGATPSGREAFYPPEHGGKAPEGGAQARVD